MRLKPCLDHKGVARPEAVTVQGGFYRQFHGGEGCFGK